MADNIIKAMSDVNLENPYSTMAEEQAEANQKRGRFALQAPPTKFFESNDAKPYQNEIAIDEDGYVGFYNKIDDSRTEFVSRERQLADQLISVVNTGILDKIVGINNNLEFYYAYRNNANVYPNNSISFPNVYKFFSLHVEQNGASILNATINNVSENARNGKLPLTAIDPNDANSYRKLPNFSVTGTTGLDNGSICIIRFYESNSTTSDPIISEKNIQIRIATGSTGAPSELIPVAIRITNTSVGTIKMRSDGSYVFTVRNSDDLTRVKFYGVVYYSIPGSTTAEYYYRDFEYDGQIQDGSTITVKYTEPGSDIMLQSSVVCKIVENPVLTKIQMIAWTDSLETNAFQGKYRVYGSYGTSGLFDITSDVDVEVNNIPGGVLSFTPADGIFDMNWRADIGLTFAELTLSSATYTLPNTQVSDFQLHIPTNDQVVAKDIYSIFIKNQMEDGEGNWTDYLKISKNNVSNGQFILKMRFGGVDGLGADTQSQKSNLGKILWGVGGDHVAEGQTIKVGIQEIGLTDSTTYTTNGIVIGDGTVSYADGTITSTIAVGSTTEFDTLANSKRVAVKFFVGDAYNSIYSTKVEIT